MMTRTRKTTRKPEARTVRLMQVGASQVLAITKGKDTTFYRLEELTTSYGRGFRLHKADRGDGPEDHYDVMLDGARTSCECLGNLKHNHCKHVEGLQPVVKSGKLPAAKPVVTERFYSETI
jgi:hypothetical protein